MSTVEVEVLRQRLLDERQRVADAIDDLHLENAGSLEDEEEMPLDNHLAETASLTLDREIDHTLEENSTNVLAAIDAALERIDKGTFGICATCDGPIGAERLEAIPYARQCIECRRKDERG